MSESPFVAISGVSGCGKSVLLQEWVQELGAGVPVLWLTGNDLSKCSPIQLEQLLHLQHTLVDIAAGTTAARANCIVDGAGSIALEEGYQNVAALMRALDILSDASKWRLVLACQQEEWQRMQAELDRVLGWQISWKRVLVQAPSREELHGVWQAFPQLQALSLQRELRKVSLRPKILDLVARRLAAGEPVNGAEWL